MKDKRLDGVHPDLVARVQLILDGMKLLGFPMMVTDGVRTLKRQQELYAQGRTQPGKIVTNADGVTRKSNHQAKADGYGYAVDCCFLVDIDGDGDLDPTWDKARPWERYGALAQALGLVWGGAWTGFVDKPHIELPLQ